jgi:hypothetical protein
MSVPESGRARPHAVTPVQRAKKILLPMVDQLNLSGGSPD